MGGFQVSTTAYGRPAVELLARQVTELKRGDPLAPVTVIVPSNYAAVSTRRALAARPGGIANVDFVTLHRLAERLSRDTRKPRAVGSAARTPGVAPEAELSAGRSHQGPLTTASPPPRAIRVGPAALVDRAYATAAANEA